MSNLINNSSSKSRHPTRFIEKKRAVIRIRNEKTGIIEQYQGSIYTLDIKDESSITLYGGHQVIVLDKVIDNFEDYTIVAMTQLW